MISQVELDRNQKRLGTLKKVRPAFMDEYEKLEAELKKCYEDYMIRSVSTRDGDGVLIFSNNLTRFRCLAFLEQQVEEDERAEQDRMEERQLATRKILEKMKQDESHRSFEGSSGVHSDGDDLDDTDDDDAASNLGADGPAEPGTSKPAKVRIVMIRQINGLQIIINMISPVCKGCEAQWAGRGDAASVREHDGSGGRGQPRQRQRHAAGRRLGRQRR